MLVPPVCLKIIKRNKNIKHTTLISKNERKSNKRKQAYTIFECIATDYQNKNEEKRNKKKYQAYSSAPP